jgi:hypothetical protein
MAGGLSTSVPAEARVAFNPVSFTVRSARCAHAWVTKEVHGYLLEDAENGVRLASGTSTLVTYDYRDSRTIPIPEDWRRAIESYEALFNHS